MQVTGCLIVEITISVLYWIKHVWNLGKNDDKASCIYSNKEQSTKYSLIFFLMFPSF